MEMESRGIRNDNEIMDYAESLKSCDTDTPYGFDDSAKLALRRLDKDGRENYTCL